MAVERFSPCKVNLILNILGKRADGFHELETLMHPVPVCDRLIIEKSSSLQLSCNHPALPCDSSNLVYRAAERFFAATNIQSSAKIYLEKNVPLAAGMGGGSSNAAHTLLGLNELFGYPLTPTQLTDIAAQLGSDIPFFLQGNPALAVGRGEQVTSLPPFACFRGMYIFLVHPGFGVSTPWAYKHLAHFPQHLNGKAGRASRLVHALGAGELSSARADLYNSLEAPVFEKYPILSLFVEFMREHGAWVAMMSGSGSTTFAIVENFEIGQKLEEAFKAKFGESCWRKLVPLHSA